MLLILEPATSTITSLCPRAPQVSPAEVEEGGVQLSTYISPEDMAVLMAPATGKSIKGQPKRVDVSLSPCAKSLGGVHLESASLSIEYVCARLCHQIKMRNVCSTYSRNGVSAEGPDAVITVSARVQITRCGRRGVAESLPVVSVMKNLC